MDPSRPDKKIGAKIRFLFALTFQLEKHLRLRIFRLFPSGFQVTIWHLQQSSRRYRNENVACQGRSVTSHKIYNAPSDQDSVFFGMTDDGQNTRTYTE